MLTLMLALLIQAEEPTFSVETPLKVTELEFVVWPDKKLGFQFEVLIQPKDFKGGKIPDRANLLLNVTNADDWELNSDVLCDGKKVDRKDALCVEVTNYREVEKVKDKALFLLDDFSKTDQVHKIRIWMYPQGKGKQEKPKVSAVLYSKPRP